MCGAFHKILASTLSLLHTVYLFNTQHLLLISLEQYLNVIIERQFNFQREGNTTLPPKNFKIMGYYNQRNEMGRK